MDGTILRKVAGLGVGAVLMFALLYLFALNQVADTTTPAMANAIDKTLARSLEPGVKSSVTMVRDGKGAAAPRVYTARLRPSAPVGGDRAAAARLCERAAVIVGGYLDEVRAPVTVRCIAEAADGTAIAGAVFTRIGDPKAPLVPEQSDPAPQAPEVAPR